MSEREHVRRKEGNRATTSPIPWAKRDVAPAAQYRVDACLADLPAIAAVVAHNLVERLAAGQDRRTRVVDCCADRAEKNDKEGALHR